MTIYFAYAVDSSNNRRAFKSTNSTSWTIGPRGNASQYLPILTYNEQISYMMDYGTGSVFRLFLSTDSGANYTQQAVNCVTNSQNDLPLNGGFKLSNGMMVITSSGGIYGSENLFGKIDPATGALPSRFKNSSTSTMPSAAAMRYSPVTDLIYIANNTGIYVINGTTGSQVRTFSITGNASNGYISFQTFQKDASLGIVPGGGTSGADLIYAVDQFYGMRKSLDSGATWSVVNNFPSGFTARFVHVDGSNLLVTGTASSDNGKVVFSSDGGATWSSIQNVATIGTSNQLDDIEKIGTTYFVSSGAGSGSYKSTNNGATWSSLGTITHNSVVYNIVNLEGFASTNSAPTDISLSSASIAENAAANATVGTLSATDAEGGAMSWALVAGAGDTDNASFMIAGDALKLANGVSLNYETKSSYSVRVQATDSGSLTYAKVFTISVTNVNEAPSNITLSAASIQEGNAVNAVIGTLSAIDPDTGDTSFTFSITGGADAAKFNISGSSLRAAQAFDYESPADADANNVYVVEITAQDAGGLTYAKSFNISVSNNTADDPVAVSSSQVVSGTGGKVVISSANNPTTSPFLLNGSALPVGSVVRWTAGSNQKFLKIDGGATDFKALPVSAPASWGWSEAGEAAWATLQNF